MPRLQGASERALHVVRKMVVCGTLKSTVAEWQLAPVLRLKGKPETGCHAGVRENGRAQILRSLRGAVTPRKPAMAMAAILNAARACAGCRCRLPAGRN